jgi:hypothetical protein
MHRVQYERANRFEAEVVRLRAAVDDARTIAELWLGVHDGYGGILNALAAAEQGETKPGSSPLNSPGLEPHPSLSNDERDQ